MSTGGDRTVPAVLHGRCHCGGVHWRFDAVRNLAENPDPDGLVATLCNCTVCRRTGALWIYGEDGHDVAVMDPEGRLASYQWGSQSLAFLFCSRCGNLVCWRGRQPGSNGRVRMAVNIRLAEPADVSGLALQVFDGLGTFEDLPRDGRRVGDVGF